MTVCISYKDGHQTHWIPVLNRYTEKPRTPVTCTQNPDAPQWFTITHPNGDEEARWVHDADRLTDMLSDNDGILLHVGETPFYQEPRRADGGSRWLNTAEAPSACILSEE